MRSFECIWLCLCLGGFIGITVQRNECKFKIYVAEMSNQWYKINVLSLKFEYEVSLQTNSSELIIWVNIWANLNELFPRFSESLITSALFLEVSLIYYTIKWRLAKNVCSRTNQSIK